VLKEFTDGAVETASVGGDHGVSGEQIRGVDLFVLTKL